MALVKASAAAASAPPPPLQPGARSAAEGADFPSGLRRESSPNESAAGRDVRGRFSSGVSSGGSRDHQQHHCHPKLRLLRGTSVKPSEKSRVGTRLDRVMMMMRREWVSVSLRHVFVLGGYLGGKVLSVRQSVSYTVFKFRCTRCFIMFRANVWPKSISSLFGDVAFCVT